jgi:hypothetical protein
MTKKSVQTPPILSSKTSQMRAFTANHKGETFTASSLAKALGWIKRKTKKVKGDDGKVTEDTVKISHNSKAALRLAKKCGATVSYEEKAKTTPNAEVIGRFTITL